MLRLAHPVAWCGCTSQSGQIMETFVVSGVDFYKQVRSWQMRGATPCLVLMHAPSDAGPTVGWRWGEQNFSDLNSTASIVVAVDFEDSRQGSLSGSTVRYSGAGEVQFDNLVVKAQPGSTKMLTFSVLEPTDIPSINLRVQLAKCKRGQFEEPGSLVCTTCPPGWPCEGACPAAIAHVFTWTVVVMSRLLTGKYSLSEDADSCKPCPPHAYVSLLTWRWDGATH